MSKNKSAFGRLTMKSMLSIFTINVASKWLEMRCMSEESVLIS
ncbi:10643_t:CDS:1, partial [Entrophospora sp. SA101]